ncbi:MAG: tRNA uridine-5-carboxymethylaminomethyl(34) synthesis GTPase MnmE [Bacteroidales bacterium]|nr:tRNA uridine-5-carboxymethylaminomethyl(34) synthesis GTPase MnmE [Bacteroidales bacterium]
MLEDISTICAPVHQPGSAITIIRVSGPRSIEVCDKIFVARRRGRITREKGFSLVFGDILSDDNVIDEVLLSIFRAPNSYTGEDMVEIACHGSFYIQNTIIALLINHGVSPAHAGEFTQRAFMNGKVDLSQAEAVADLIASESEVAHRIAVSQLKGGISNEISGMRAELLNLVSLLELELDFGEEDVEFADRKRLSEIASGVRDYAKRLISSFAIGNAVKRGIPVAITGRPNVGKSTLLNGILNEERAIVSEIPGTTRDAIEDTFTIGGVLFRFIDTAGIRHTDDVIENLGIKKTREKISQASVVVFLTEATLSAEEISSEIVQFMESVVPQGKPLIVVINKTDLASIDHIVMVRSKIRIPDNIPLLFMSAGRSEEYSPLKDTIASLSGVSALDDNHVVITNARHYEAMLKVAEAMDRVADGIAGGLSSDLIALDTRQAIHYLGEITGEITTDEILGNIFRNFCIGK